MTARKKTVVKIIGKIERKPPLRLARKPSRRVPEVDRAAKAAQNVPTDAMMMVDTFNVVHCRIALADGLGPVGDGSIAREKLFGLIATLGWERTLALLASCARLFAEVPTPLPAVSKIGKQFLHQLACDLDARQQPMRHVDREVAKGRG